MTHPWLHPPLISNVLVKKVNDKQVPASFSIRMLKLSKILLLDLRSFQMLMVIRRPQRLLEIHGSSGELLVSWVPDKVTLLTKHCLHWLCLFSLHREQEITTRSNMEEQKWKGNKRGKTACSCLLLPFLFFFFFWIIKVFVGMFGSGSDKVAWLGSSWRSIFFFK